MRTIVIRPAPFRPVLSIACVLLGALACAESKVDPAETAPGGEGPFKAVQAVANAPDTFSSPRAGAPLADGSVVLLATLEGALAGDIREDGERVAILMQAPGTPKPSLLYSGERLVNPLDLALSLDERTVYIADPAGGPDGNGAISSMSSGGGEPEVVLAGYAPRAVTVADDDRVYFSGVGADSGAPGVFELRAGAALPVFEGPPLVDPSGIAVQADGSLLIADTRLFDGASGVSSEAGIVRIAGGQASIFASGFATGYPAGIALTRDEKTLIVSGEGPDRSDTVYLVDMGQPAKPPTPVTSEFSRYQDASAGLKRAHDSNTFIWASLAANGGTVFRIVAN